MVEPARSIVSSSLDALELEHALARGDPDVGTRWPAARSEEPLDHLLEDLEEEDQDDGYERGHRGRSRLEIGRLSGGLKLPSGVRVDLPFGEEGGEELLDDLLVALGQVPDLPEALEELAVLETGLGGLVHRSLEERGAGDTEGVGEPLESVGGGAGEAALVAALRPREPCLGDTESRTDNPGGRV